MRKIFPENNDIIGLQDESTRPVTQQDLVNIQNQIEQVATDLSNAVNNLENYKTSQSQHVSTGLLDAANVAITTLQSTNATLQNANISTLTVGQLNELSNLVARVAAFVSLTTTDATVTNSLNANIISASEITVDNLKATNTQISNWTITNLGVDSVIANVINTQNVNTTNVSSENENTQNLNVSTKAIVKEADIESADISGLKSDKIETSVINWKDYTTIVDPDVYYIKVPHFTNGHYFIEGRNNGEKLFNIEITNSLSNYTINWGKKDDQKWIEEVYIDETLGNVWIKANTLEKTIDLYYANINADCIDSPATYDTLQITPDETYPIVYRNGSKFFGPVDLMDNRNFEPLDLIPSDDYAAATTGNVHYTVTEPEEFRVYLPDQSLNTDDSVEFYDTKTTFLNVSDFRVPPTFVVSKIDDDTTLDLASFDDGALIAFRKNGQSYVYQKRTNNLSQPVLYPVATTNGMPAVRTNIPIVWDPDTKSLVESRTINADVLSVGRVEGNLHVTGDLTVDGTTHTVDVEEVAATGDIITLRANNNNPLASNQVSGLVINKYDGTKDLALGTSSDGTLRVGTATGTDVTYNDIALKHEDNLYYTFDNLLPPNYTLLNPQPQGTMSSWTGKSEVEGYTKYTSAVFTQVDITTMQPVLTRNESNSMVGAMPLVWDASGTKAVTKNATRSHQIFETDDNGNPFWRNREDVTVGWAEWANYKNYSVQNVDLTSLDQNTWYPVTLDLDVGTETNIYFHNTLNGVNHPSWATHGAGFASVGHIVAQGGGWSSLGEGVYEIMYDWQGFYTGEAPVGWQWNSPNSWFIFWLRGGAVYYLSNDRGRAFTLHPTGATAADGQVYSPVAYRIASLPIASITANLAGTASEATHAIAADNANYASTSGGVRATYPGGSVGDLIYANMGDNDQFRLQIGGVSNDGWVELATADDGTEPIFVRQYTGAFQNVAHQAILLDANGNTSFPGTVTAPNFSGLASESVLTRKIRVGNSNPTSGDIWVD